MTLLTVLYNCVCVYCVYVCICISHIHIYVHAYMKVKGLLNKILKKPIAVALSSFSFC